WGGVGQGAYAAANAFLDGLAHRRHARSLPSLSIDWGMWSGGGISEQDARFQTRLAELGVLPMSPASALAAMGRLLGGRAVQCAVTRMDWARFAPVYAARGRRNLLASLTAAD